MSKHTDVWTAGVALSEDIKALLRQSKDEDYVDSGDALDLLRRAARLFREEPDQLPLCERCQSREWTIVRDVIEVEKVTAHERAIESSDTSAIRIYCTCCEVRLDDNDDFMTVLEWDAPDKLTCPTVVQKEEPAKPGNWTVEQDYDEAGNTTGWKVVCHWSNGTTVDRASGFTTFQQAHAWLLEHQRVQNLIAGEWQQTPREGGYWEADPEFPHREWQREVAELDTLQGYHEWLKDRYRNVQEEREEALKDGA